MSALLAITLATAAPLLWAAMGGLLSERSGVVNIALEGKILGGAFAAVAVSGYTGHAELGLVAAAATGALLGLLHVWLCLGCRIDQIVSGVAINLLALGVTGYAVEAFYGLPGTTPRVAKIGLWRPLGEEGLAISPLHISVIAVWLLLAIFVNRTPWGLRLHAAGENPEALHSAGGHVTRIRILAVVVGGALAGLGGAELSISRIDHFSIGMSGGRGFLALAALICGRWRPGGILLACLAFGLLDTVGHRLQSLMSVPGQLLLTFPFLAALLALGLSGWGSRQPSALGRPFVTTEPGAVSIFRFWKSTNDMPKKTTGASSKIDS